MCIRVVLQAWVEWIIKTSARKGVRDTVLKNPAGRRDSFIYYFLHIGLLFYFRKEE
jgi:hypothetical protein